MDAAFQVVACGPEAAEEVHRLTQAAFRDYARLDPPSGAGAEDVASVRADLAEHGGALALEGDRVVGCLRLRVEPDHLHVRRMAVEPARQGRGAGRAMMAWAEREAGRRGFDQVRLGVRLDLPRNLELYRRLGYRAIAEHGHPETGRPFWLEMGKHLGAGSGPGHRAPG